MLVFVSVSHSMYPVEMEPSTDITRNKQRYTSQNIHTVILIGNLPKKKKKCIEDEWKKSFSNKRYNKIFRFFCFIIINL